MTTTLPFLIAALSASPERQSVPFREALSLAATQSPDLAIARAQSAIAAAAKGKSLTAWQPDVSGTLTFDHTSAPAILSFPQLAFALGIPPNPAGPQEITLQGANSWFGTLLITQPFFTPQGLFLLAPAAAGADAAALSADEQREQILLSTARTYLTLIGLAQLKSAAQDALAVAKRRETDAHHQLEAGTGTEVAMLRAQSETAQAQATLAQLDGQRESLLALLDALTVNHVQPDLAQPIPALPGPAEEAANPWESTYGVRAAKRALDAADGVVTFDDFAWLPSIAGVAKGNYNSNQGFVGTNTYYDLIVQLSVPIYDRGMRYAQLHEDLGKRSQARAQLDSARAHARASWVAARSGLESATAVYEQAKSQASLAARVQRQVESSAKAGVATNLELSDADAQQFLAASQLAQAGAAVQISRAEVAAAEGRLNHDLLEQ